MRRPLMLLLLLALAFAGPARAEEDLLFFRKLHADGLHAVAAGQMDAWLARNPNHADRVEILYLLGRSHEALEQAEPMMRRLAEFVDLLPGDPRACEALYDAASTGARAGLLVAADPLADRLLRDYPDCALHQAAILLGARIKRGLGDRAAALQMLSFLVESAGEGEILCRALYERAGIKGEADAAAARPDLEALKANLPRHPLAGFASLQLAEQALDQGDENAARVELDWILDHFDEEELRVRALSRRAGLHEQAGRPGAAAADLARLREQHPTRIDVPASLAREVALLMAAGEGRAAVARADDYQRSAGGTALSFALLGRALEAADRREQAAVAWARAADLDPAGDLGLEALARRFHLLVDLDSREEIPAATGRLLARLDAPEARAELLLDLGDYHARAGRTRPALRAWERVESEAGASGLEPEALFRLARLAEDEGDWRAAGAYYERLMLEFGASARGIEARERREALERYYRSDTGAAVERLLGILDEERREGAARGREFRVGQVLLEELKDFPRAADYFRELAGEQSSAEGRAWARLFAGRAALREAERLVLSGESGSADRWRSGALLDLEACRAEAIPRVLAEADYELTLLRLDEQASGADRLPVLDAYLAAHGDLPRAARIYYERGEIYRNEQWSDSEAGLARARADHERALELDPEGPWSPKARLGAGLAALALTDHEGASGHFRRLVETAPGRYEGGEARFGLGQIEEARKRFRRALDHYQAFLAGAPTSPRRPRCLIHIGDCHYFLREWDLAAAAYTRLLSEHAENPLRDDARYRLALTDEQRGDTEAAQDQLRALLADGRPRFRREAAWRLGRGAADAGRRTEAIAALEALVALGWSGPHSEEGGLLLGGLLLEEGRGEAARAHYDSLLARVDLGDETPRARAERVRALLMAGDGPAAAEAWAALESEADIDEEERARVLLAFGRERAGAADAAQALSYFDTCLQRHPDSAAAPWALYEGALLAARRRDFDAALAGFDQLSRRYPDSEAARRGAAKAGGILYSRGEYESASERYEWTLGREDEPDADLLYHSALALEKRGEVRGASERVQLFLARHPEDERVPEAMMKIGYFLQSLGQYERAVLAYRNAELFQDREGKARLHFWIGDCFQAMGERDSALAAFLKVGYLYGDQGLWGVTATLRAAALYEESGDLKQGRQLYEKVLSSQGAGSDFGRSAAEALARISASEVAGEEGRP